MSNCCLRWRAKLKVVVVDLGAVRASSSAHRASSKHLSAAQCCTVLFGSADVERDRFGLFQRRGHARTSERGKQARDAEALANMGTLLRDGVRDCGSGWICGRMASVPQTGDLCTHAAVPE